MTSKKSMQPKKTNGALLLILSNNWPPTRVNMSVPICPKKANMPIMVPRISFGMLRIKSTSIEMASITVNTMSEQHMKNEATDYGSLMYMKEKPQNPRRLKAAGTMTLDGT